LLHHLPLKLPAVEGDQERLGLISKKKFDDDDEQDGAGHMHRIDTRNPES
jgi:hypothetical protein